MADIANSSSWKELLRCSRDFPPLQSLFAQEPGRFQEFSFSLPGVLIDFSKTPLTREIRDHLIDLAREAGLEEVRRRFFAGDRVNATENRAAFHMALRAPCQADMRVGGVNVVPEVQATLSRMRRFADSVRGGQWLGHGGLAITDIVNIGIGGSHLGPQLVTEALSRYHHPRLNCHFVSNADPLDLELALKRLSPETTLFIVASKTFTTVETMQNAKVAREWIVSYHRSEAAVAAHFVAASVNAKAVAGFGIAPGNMFPFQDWVGGRYSVWSSIGLSAMILAGPDRFAEFLAGAHDVDEHFKTAPFEKNLPVLMALLGVWYRNFLDYPSYAVLPYHAGLRRLPSFLQQLDMESNGKSVGRDGARAKLKTGPLVFGEPGTDVQHIFCQWLHQGQDIVPVDFIGAVRGVYEPVDHQSTLLANFLAQGEALLKGQEDDARPYRRYPGGRPSTTILFDEFNARALGMLLALYEHKVFVQGVIWGINSFDQWGVELGKTLAKALEEELSAETAGAHDGSTQGLLDYILRCRAKQAFPLAA